MSSLDRHPLIRSLRNLDLPTDDYVVFGSGPLLAHGLRTDIGDLDLVACGRAWARLTKLGRPVACPSGHGQMVRLVDRGLVVEAVDRWLPGWHTGDLIASAEHHSGVPFAPVAAVRRSKQVTARPKDLADLAAIDAVFAAVF